MPVTHERIIGSCGHVMLGNRCPEGTDPGPPVRVAEPCGRCQLRAELADAKADDEAPPPELIAMLDRIFDPLNAMIDTVELAALLIEIRDSKK